MKNLVIKRVALGLLLAGYSASGAFASISATTSNTIEGRVPLVNAQSITQESLAKNSVDITVFDKAGNEVTDKNTKWQTGYKLVLKYKTVDADGDSESTTGIETGKTIQFGYKDSAGDWHYSAAAATTQGESVQWIIPAEAANATALAYAIRPTTQYGAPLQANWVVGLVNSDKDSGDGGGDDGPKNPGDDNGTGGGGTGGGTGPVLPGEDDFIITVWESTITGGAVNYETNVTTSGIPTIGKIYAAKVVRKSDSVDVTENYTYQWKLADATAAQGGQNKPAGGSSSAAATVLTAVSGTTTVGIAHELKANAEYPGYEAGAQGFRLQVSTVD